MGIWSCGGNTSNSENETQSTDVQTAEMSTLDKEHRLEMVSYADSVNRGLLVDTVTGSARLEVEGQVGNTLVTINHGSPGVRGRVIWNGLVSYDQVWVSGSHWATAVTFSHDVTVNGVDIPAGIYALFTIPGREEWTWIINTNYDQHLAEEYTESEDLVRLNVKPIALENTVQRLNYEVMETGNRSGIIALSWDKIRIELPFQFE
ncbi:DUF2911 domain-containing protein [Lunatibacter salilacus]|uniref:DUF2911 domain-containing protein n=1 Tax=Lunatibacter salilacus TaxID=2483804 RepID=UPI001F1FADC3|nr:DUF2911 domain-containing protein [Lunatibacter salilacus]